MFEIFEPTIFPIEIESAPLKTAKRLTKSSGADVPKATTVAPTTNWLSPLLKAKELDPLTSISPA